MVALCRLTAFFQRMPYLLPLANVLNDFLQSVDTTWSSASVARFDYTYDAVGRRSSAVQTGAIFTRYPTGALASRYGYDSRSQLTSAAVSTGTDPDDATKRLSGRQYGYSFDYTGNRTSSAVDNRTVTYTNNHSADTTQNVNQIGQRTTPGYVDVTGWAPSASIVTVNGQTASRQGDHFFRSPTFGTMPTWQDLTVNCDFGGSETRHGFLAANPETYVYDYDGNLTDDGRWHYTWDAENRLITMETISAAYGVGAPRQKIEFKYDYLGRRVEKAVYSWNLSLGTWDLVTRQRFLYSGWNLIGEYAASGSTLTLTRSYTWGLDLGTQSDGVRPLDAINWLRVVSHAAGSGHGPQAPDPV